MTFTSLPFLAFVASLWALYWIAPSRWRNPLLLAASYLFCGAFQWPSLAILLFSSLVAYSAGVALETSTSSSARRRLLALSLCCELGLLAIFKYLTFLSSTLQAVLAAIGASVTVPVVHIGLPLGISYYTFICVGYIIDVYRRQQQATRSARDFALFVSFFPHIPAGPIARASSLLTQIRTDRRIGTQQIARAVFLVLFGLFKKLAIADGVAQAVSAVYDSHGQVSSCDVLLATYLYTIQIYCDFSGYTDIARGVAKLFGFNLMVNFDTPYLSRNPREFWRRWHISLSTWLRDYLYIPLGGNRRGRYATYYNLMATMILGGLWHGAAWNFVLWGAYQGAALSVHRILGADRETHAGSSSLYNRLASVVAGIVCFHVISYGWLLFRAKSLSQIVHFTRVLAAGGYDLSVSVPKPTTAALAGMVLLVAWECCHFLTKDAHFYLRLPAPARGAIYATVVFVLLMGLSNESAQFIYVQF